MMFKLFIFISWFGRVFLWDEGRCSNLSKIWFLIFFVFIFFDAMSVYIFPCQRVFVQFSHAHPCSLRVNIAIGVFCTYINKCCRVELSETSRDFGPGSSALVWVWSFSQGISAFFCANIGLPWTRINVCVRQWISDEREGNARQITVLLIHLFPWDGRIKVGQYKRHQ